MKLTSSMLNSFEEDGYLVVRDLLDWQSDLQPVLEEYEVLLDELVERWYKEHRLSTLHSDLPFGERLTEAVAEAKLPYDRHFDISLPQGNISNDTPIHTGPAVFSLLRNPRLLDVVEQFLGPELFSAPIQHARIKLPESRLPTESRTGLTGSIGWHQDLATVVEDADESDILTVWLPMTKAEVENGCLTVVPGSHRKGLIHHCRINDQVCIPDHLLHDHGIPIPMSPGDVLFMHRRTTHAGLPNVSDTIRWSFDLRYQPAGQASARPWFPGFIVRSKSNPQSELSDPEEWARQWCETRSQLARSGGAAFYRWQHNDPLCA